MWKISAVLAIVLASTMTYADVNTVNSQLEKQYPNLNFQHIQPTEMHGVYSAMLDNQIVYVDEAAAHVLFGSMIRLKDQKNLTKDLAIQNNKVDWSTLPLQDAIKTVKGNGQHKIAIFSDPNCPYCKKLELELDHLNNVTIYTFLYPIRPQSIFTSKQVWCSTSRAYYWKKLIRENITPQNDASCDTPVQRNLMLGQKLGIDGTPGIIFSNGFKTMGYIPAAEIETVWKDAGI